MGKFLLLLLLATYSQVCISQNMYRGRAISALTGRGIRGALIEKAGKLVADTDSLGYFTIELDSTENIILDFSTIEVGNISTGGLQFKKDGILQISLLPDCRYSPSKDLKQGKLKLLMAFTPISPPLTNKDFDFERKYKIRYFGYGDGCVGNVTDCIEIYNKAIAAYLDKRYGKRWRMEVNKDVPGL